MSGAPTAITIEPGALRDVPIMAFIEAAHAFGLRMGPDMVIRRTAEPDIEAIQGQRNGVPIEVLAVLRDTEKWLIGERDWLYEQITDAEGNIRAAEVDNNGEAYLRQMDAAIDRIQAVRRKYGGGA